MKGLAVDTYLGHKGEPMPRAFTHEGRTRTIREILTTWRRDDATYYRVSTQDGARYVLRHDEELERWELVMQEEG